MVIMVGMSGSVNHTVTAADSAVALSSGTVDVLGTPRVVAWCEEATMEAISAGLRESDVCVGTRITLEHVEPAAIGQNVVASASVIATDGRIITFEVELRHDEDHGGTLLAHGEIIRVVLARERFLARLDQDNDNS